MKESRFSFSQADSIPVYDIPINISTTHTHTNTSKPEEGKKTPEEEEAQREGRRASEVFLEREYCREQVQTMIGCL